MTSPERLAEMLARCEACKLRRAYPNVTACCFTDFPAVIRELQEARELLGRWLTQGFDTSADTFAFLDPKPEG